MCALRVSVLDEIVDYTVDKPRPLIGCETIQIILIREVLDFTVLRTEESRELNSATTPLSEKHRDQIKRVAFLATKQKAAESRQLSSLLRTATEKADLKVPECFLKDNLCMSCPRCGLFGATALSEEANIKHRIEYSTAFSLLPFEQITDEITFNAVGENDQRTGQALGSRHVVRPATLFPSIVTLKAVTKTELILAIKTLLSCKSYGAETRIGGDIRNSIMAIVLGWEEIITPLELTLELYDLGSNLDPSSLEKVLKEKYAPLCGNPDHLKILSSAAVESLVQECAETTLDKQFLTKAYDQIAEYRQQQDPKKEKKKKG
ncbi:MAG: type I-D CRISPR-associated protein Cas7/Csc2 [Candidatus Obscuribacterales bacterium]|nr:type I-D CRISPR-associated protein Cas7/Csc2 [Candidatus Obscuribacterales bacterium]